MAASIQIAMEGPGAELALGEFLGISGLTGQSEMTNEDSQPRRDGGTLAAVGVIVGIAGGLVTIVDKIIAWREKWVKSREAGTRLAVVIEDGRGNRLALDSATPEQITAALETLARAGMPSTSA